MKLGDLSQQQQQQHSDSSVPTDNYKSSEGKKYKKIFLVDDEQDILDTFKIGLEDTGLFEVDTLADPQLALSNISNVGLSYYDLLLIDIKMPQMNGFDLYQQIENKFGAIQEEEEGKRKDKVSPDTSSRRITPKVCFMTAYEIYYEILKREFPTLNVGCFIKKPIGIQDLINRIKQELEL
jgi:two-component system, OmpR family, response regulator ChvI